MQWNMDHSRHNIEDVAAGYEALPTYDPKAEHAWQQLADESKKHADYIRQHLNVTETDNPEPYDNSEDMIRDIRNNRNFVVSTANSEHPIWTPEQNVNFRIVHDVFGHAATEGDFGWHGENDACSTHFALSSPHAQKALATECLGQTGYAIHRGGFTDQKVGFIPGLHEGLAAANKDTPIPTQAQLMQRALYGPSKQSKWKTAANAATEQRIQRIADQARSKGLDVQQYDNDGYLETQIHIGQDEYYDSRYVIYISHGNNRTQSIFYDRPESKDYRTNLSAIEQEINSIDSENFDEMDFGRQTGMFDDKKILWNRFSRIKRSQDANRMYRQHTDGPPAAETTFESIQNEDTSDEHEDEIKIINGKKWRMVRRKNNPQPDTYKDPIGGWGFYSKWKLSVPPAEKAKEFGEGYEEAPAPSSKEIEERYKYNKDPRGHRWQLNKENLERLYNHPEWPLESKYNVFPLSLEQAQLKGREKPDLSHWNRAALGTHESPQGKNRSGFIYINPLISPESANEALWHELQHAYQHQEERFTKELRDAYFDPTKIDPSLTDEEVAKKFEEEYVKHPMEIDANLFADFMRRYPIIEEAAPVYKENWVGRGSKDMDIKNAIDKYYQEYGSKRRLPLPSIKSKWKIISNFYTTDPNMQYQNVVDSSHDYDPEWDYEIETNQEKVNQIKQIIKQQLPSIQEYVKQKLNVPTFQIHFVKDLEGDVARYVDGTYDDPVVLIDADAHLQGTEDISHLTHEIITSIVHELAHAYEEMREEDHDEDFAEGEGQRWSYLIKEAPARSKAQFRYMQGICNGSIEPPKGMTRAQACEYVEGQSPKNLPEKKSNLVKNLELQERMEQSLIKAGFSNKAAILMALDNMSKLSYWIDGYHATVALRDPESGDWHMDVGFSDKLTHGGVTADYINDLGTKAMRKAVADKDSRTDYYNYHTARGLYNPTTKDFIHMSHPDFWDETEYNFKDLDQDSRDRMEEFWRSLAEQNNIELNDVRVLNNQTGHIEDLSVSDLKMPEEVQREMRMRERERPLTPWEIEHGGYDTKTGSVKNSHWLENYHAAVITPKGEMKIAKDWTQFHGSLLPDAATLAKRQFHRGLYNKETGQLLHMTSPEEWKKLEDSWGDYEAPTRERWPLGFEWFNDPQHFISPYKTEKEWLKAAECSQIPISEVKFFSGEPEVNPFVGFKVDKFNLHSPQEIAAKYGKWKTSKKDAWEAVLDGEMGHDILTTGTWEEVKKQTIKWLKQLKNGYINKKHPHDNKKIDPEAKEQDGHALEDLKLYEEKKRWSFHFDHGKHPYDLIIQPVGYKESKWKISMAVRGRPLSSDQINQLIKDYEAGMSLDEVSKKNNLNRITVRKYLILNNIDRRGPSSPRGKIRQEELEKRKQEINQKRNYQRNENIDIINDYIRGVGISELAFKYNTNYQAIRRILLRNNIPLNTTPRIPKIETPKVEFNTKSKTVNKILDLYYNKNKNIQEIGNEFNQTLSQQNIRNIIKQYGLKQSKWKKSQKNIIDHLVSQGHRYLYHSANYNQQFNWPESDANDYYEKIKNIMSNGLRPQRELGFSSAPRSYGGHPDFVYLSSDPAEIIVDITKLNPNNFVADDDMYLSEWQDAEEGYGTDLGEWVHNESGLVRPEDVFDSIPATGAIAYRGIIPPQALSINPGFLDKNYRKKSKWRKRSHWVEGFHAAGITPEGEMVVGPKWTTYHGELKTPNSIHKTFDPRAGWRGLYNPDTNELLHLTTPEEYGRFIYTETAEDLEDFKNPHDFYRDAWQSAADKSNYPVESISLFVDKNNVNPAERNDRGSFDLTKIGKWKVSDKKKNKVHPKFQTSLKDHKRSVRKRGPLKTHGVRNFKKKSVLNSEEGQALFEYEPYMYHDVAAARTKGELQDQIDTVRSILNNGILPKEQTGVSEYTDWLTSRPDHVYIGRKGFYPRTVPPAIRINMSKVDPSTLKPDEDIYHAFGFSDKHKDQIDMHELKSAPFEEEHRNNPDYTLGQWMEDHSHLDTPKNVLASYLLNNSLAVHGGVPADALEINPEWVDHIKDRHGIDITKML